MKARELRENEEQAGKRVIYERAHLAQDDDDDACHHDEKIVMLPSQDRANTTTDVRLVYHAFVQKINKWGNRNEASYAMLTTAYSINSKRSLHRDSNEIYLGRHCGNAEPARLRNE